VTRIAVIQTGMRGGWANVHTQSLWEFYGPTRSNSMNLTLAVLGMVLVAGAALTTLNHRAETARRRSEQRFRALIQNASDLFTVLGPDGRIRYDSPSVATVLGYAPGGRDGMRAIDTMHPSDQSAARAVFTQVIADPGAVGRLQCRIEHANGGYRWVDISVSNLLANDAVHGIVVNARDISDSRRLQEQMSHQALHDALTGLPNRRMFYERLEGSLGRRRHGDEQLALVFVDLDGFKPVNDSLGHDAGDELLRQVGHRFRACLRTGDTLARVGGDEFVVLLDELTGLDDAVAVADRIVASLHAPFALRNTDVWIGASVGVTLVEPGADPQAALRHADAAMYRAKQAGGHQFAISPQTTRA
jgi:diguanylate cyclase (GGDEF)-like protein/PAS domain S-box-containing protein